MADLIFEANLRIAAVEQVILDDAVTLVIDHVPRHFTAEAEGRLVTFAERSLRVPRRIAQINSSRRIAGAAAVATDLWARVMTDQVMVVAFPAETIRLGRDIPRRDWRRPFYAPGLKKLSPSASALRPVRPIARRRARGRRRRLATVRRPHELRRQPPAVPAAGPHALLAAVHRRGRGAGVERWYPSRMADPFEQAVRRPWLPDDLGTSPGDEGAGMTVWTHDLLDELRQIGDPPLDDRGRSREWTRPSTARRRGVR